MCLNVSPILKEFITSDELRHVCWTPATGRHSNKKIVGWLHALRPSNMLVYLRDGSAQTVNFTCCHTEIEVVDQTFYLTQSQHTGTGPTSPSTDPTTPSAWQGSHWSASFEVTGMTRPGKIPSQAGVEPRTFRSRGGRLNH